MSATVKTCQLLIHTSFLKKIKNEEGKIRRKKLHMAFLHDRHIKLQTGLKSLKWLLEDRSDVKPHQKQFWLKLQI